MAKNAEFIKFVEEVSKLSILNLGKMKDILVAKMDNKKKVQENLIALISKIGEKITLRRTDFFESKNVINFSYVHSALKNNIGKIGVLLSLETTKKKDEISEFGRHLAMHIAATSPLAIDKDNLDQKTLEKEKEIITEELKNAGKDDKIIAKIAIGKLNKYVSDNTLLNQEWILEPKKKVKDVLKEVSGNDKIEINKFIRFKVGEGV